MEVIAPTRVVQNHHLDSTNWDFIEFRDGDVIVANWARSGGSWAQQIACQLMFGGREDAELIKLSAWPEWQAITREEAASRCQSIEDRRIFKSHLPADAIPIDERARYIYVARDPRDLVWSLHPHHANYSHALYESMNQSPKRVGPPCEPPDPDIRSYYRTWVTNDGAPFWPYWSHIQSWWDIRCLPNVLLIHFDELKEDMEAQICRIAEFIDVEIDPATWPAIIEHCSFDWMKAHAETLVSSISCLDLSKVLYRGETGRWRAMLSEEEAALADTAAFENLSGDCYRWLMRC